MSDFNAELSNNFLGFCESYNRKSLTKKPKCFKIPDNSTCTDLILTNRQKCFQNSTIIETGLSGFHRLTVTLLKSYFKKLKSIKLTYCDYKNFPKQ